MDSSFILDEILSQSTTNENHEKNNRLGNKKYEEKDKKENLENSDVEKKLKILEDTDEFLEKYIYGSGLFDAFVEKHISSVSNLDTYRSRQTEPKWKVKQLIKEKFQNSKQPISKEEMKKEIAEYYLKNSVWNTKINIAFENYCNTDDIKKEIMEMMVDEKIKLVPEGNEFYPIKAALEKEKSAGNFMNSILPRKSRFSSTIPEKNQNLSKPSVIDISTIKHVSAQIKEEKKPKVLPPVNLAASYHSYVVNYYNTPPIFNPNIPPPIIVDSIYPISTNVLVDTSSSISSSISSSLPQESSQNMGPVDISDSDSDMSMDSPDKDSKDNEFNIITPPPPPPCLFDSTEEDIPPPPPPNL